jgi:hypothetical protein
MTMQDRDKRALLLLGAAAAVSLAVYLWPEPGTAAATPAGAAAQAEQRLLRMREVAATVPARLRVLEQAGAEVSEREQGLLRAETAAQAQALLLQIARELLRAQSPPIEIQQTEIGQVVPLGKHYGEAMTSLSFPCRIEQLVNLLADLSARPELIATRDLQIRTADPKQKTLQVRLTVSGVIARSLLPERQGPLGL